MDAVSCRYDVLTVPYQTLTFASLLCKIFMTVLLLTKWMLHCVQHRPDFHYFTLHYLAPLAAYTCTFPLWGFMVERTGAFHYGLSKLALAKTCGDLEVDEQTKGVPF